MLKYAVDKEASDLHVSVGYPPMVRLDGELKKIDLPVLKKTDVSGMIDDILTSKQKEHFKEHHEIDFAYEMDKIGRFRCNVYTTMNGVAGAFRVIPNKIRTLDDIGAPEGAYTLARLEKGLVLVTGPTGSGKSTTLAAVIYLINSEKKKHITTIEDPSNMFIQG